MSTMLLQSLLLSQSHVPPCRGGKCRDLLKQCCSRNSSSLPQSPSHREHLTRDTVTRCSSWCARHWCRKTNSGYSQQKWHSYKHETLKGTALCTEGNCLENSPEQGRRWSWSLVGVQVIVLRDELFPQFLQGNSLTIFSLMSKSF